MAARTSARADPLDARTVRRDCSGADDGTRTRGCAESDTSSGRHGPFRTGLVGPYSPTMGAPTAAARCSGPVSPDTISRAPRASASTSPIRVGGASRAAPADAATTSRARSSSCGPQSTMRRRAVDLLQPRRDLAERRRRPPLVRPGGAGVEQRVGSLDDRPGRHVEGKRDLRDVHAERGRELQVLFDHVMPARDVPALAVEHRRRALAQHVAREADHASRAREPREHGGLEEPLEVERRVVPLAHAAFAARPAARATCRRDRPRCAR